MSHHCCHATGCNTYCAPEKLMCWPHWRLVPSVIQSAVYRHYRAGQCDDMNPSEKWHVAADAAIGAVALLEGRPIRAAQLKALMTVPASKLENWTLVEKLTKLTKSKSRQLQE